jgi:hypothetical protein
MRSAQIVSMYKMASQANKRAQSDRVLLKFISMALDLKEREANLLGLDAKTRKTAQGYRGQLCGAFQHY